MTEGSLSELEGKNFFESFFLERGACYASLAGTKVIIEPVLYPLVCSDLELIDPKTVLLKFPYGYEVPLPIVDLKINDWSFLCGLTPLGVPFGLHRVQTEKFFSLVSDRGSEIEFRVEDIEYELEDWLIDIPEVSKSNFWSERYLENNTPWDLDRSHPAIDFTVNRLKLHRGQIIVPGFGRGHDLIELSKKGHLVTGVEFSKLAVEKSVETYPELKGKVHEADFFKFSRLESSLGAFDYVFEHTLFCALRPSQRKSLVSAWSRVLREEGALIGIFYMGLRREGPPFGVTEFEVVDLLSSHFNIEYFGRLRGDETARPGRELFVFARKKGFKS